MLLLQNFHKIYISIHNCENLWTYYLSLKTCYQKVFYDVCLVASRHTWLVIALLSALFKKVWKRPSTRGARS